MNGASASSTYNTPMNESTSLLLQNQQQQQSFGSTNHINNSHCDNHDNDDYDTEECVPLQTDSSAVSGTLPFPMNDHE
jgi:hypothetical protein